jgi:hypothetical protein
MTPLFHQKIICHFNTLLKSTHLSHIVTNGHSRFFNRLGQERRGMQLKRDAASLIFAREPHPIQLTRFHNLAVAINHGKIIINHGKVTSLYREIITDGNMRCHDFLATELSDY